MAAEGQAGMGSVWDGFVGHAEVRTAFERAEQRGRLTQAYLLVGPEGIGKQTFAKRMAQCLLCERREPGILEACGECRCCRPFLAGTHPDFLLVERDPGKRELSVGKFVGEKEQRGKAGLCYEFSIRPVAGMRKVAIINDADTMNDEAANALLKTLEEPPEGAVIFLIAASPEALLPTIRSRCQQVRFQRLPDSDIAQYLQEAGLITDAAEAAEMAILSQGSRSLARRLAQPGFRELRRDWLSELSSARPEGMTAARRLLEGVEQISSEVPEQRQTLHWLLLSAAEHFRLRLREVCHTVESEEDAGGEIDLDRSVDLLEQQLDHCRQAAAYLDQNVSLALNWESLCAALARTGKTTKS